MVVFLNLFSLSSIKNISRKSICKIILCETSFVFYKTSFYEIVPAEIMAIRAVYMVKYSIFAIYFLQYSCAACNINLLKA